MVQLQTLNKILQTKDISIITSNALTPDYFKPYEKEAQFIIEHFNKYKTVPDMETFISNFQDFTPIEVTESDSYLLNTLAEEKLYRDAVPIIKKSAEILKTNSNDAVEYLMSQMKPLSGQIGIHSVDIIQQAFHRLQKYQEKVNGEDSKFFITTGFEELDAIVHGWQRGEELIILFARTNQGKSWILTKMLTHAWQIGNNVGFISPEMSDDTIGYRFDTLYQHFDNQSLNFGKPIENYEQYIKDLTKKENKFLVATPADFDRVITVSKLRTFILNNNIQILGIDGMSYLTDERVGRYDKREAELTHISEDLMSLSVELEIPIIGVVQANRDGVTINGGNLQLENIRDADGIAFNASKVLSIRQKVDEETLELSVKKNRSGAVGDKFLYHWHPATGDFIYMPSTDDGVPQEKREEKITELKNKFELKKGTKVF